MTIVLTAATLALFFAVRTYPLLGASPKGCDSYYFLLTAEQFKKQRKIPVRLPGYYLADIDEQWYPPGFTLLLGMLPEKFLVNHYWIINFILDFLNLLLMDLFIWLVIGSSSAVLVANLIYIFTPVAAKEYFSLTSRSLGNLLFTLFVISLYYLAVCRLRPDYAPAALLAAFLVLFTIMLTHKLTLQLCVFVSAGLSAVYHTWIPIFVVLGGIPLTIILTRGYYWKILKGHWDIISFWNKNVKWLGAHQVYDSPIYGGCGSGPARKEPGVISRLTGKFVPLVSYNPYVLFALFLITARRGYFGYSDSAGYLSAILALVFIWSMVTTFVPYLVSIGEGYRYCKYAIFPASVLIGMTFDSFNYVDKAGLLVVFLLSLFSMLKATRAYRRADPGAGRQDESFMEMMDFIKQNGDIDRLGCLSAHMCDPIVYFTRRKVLWGTHHYLFNEKIVKFFPVLRSSLDDLSREFGVRYWCVNTNYVHPVDVGLMSSEQIVSFGQYALYRAHARD